MYDPNAPEDDMNERYEEMNRMREHVMNELDKDKDKLVSFEEFMKYTASNEFEKDEPWEVRQQDYFCFGCPYWVEVRFKQNGFSG